MNGMYETQGRIACGQRCAGLLIRKKLKCARHGLWSRNAIKEPQQDRQSQNSEDQVSCSQHHFSISFSQSSVDCILDTYIVVIAPHALATVFLPSRPILRNKGPK